MRLTLISLSAARRTLFLRVTQLVKSLCFLLSQQEVGLFGENFSYPVAQRPVCSRSLPPTLHAGNAQRLHRSLQFGTELHGA